MKIPERWTFKSDEVASNFDAHVRETLPWYDLVTEAVSLICRHYIPQGGTVYDIGASTGNIGNAIADTLVERSAKIIPIDDSLSMADCYRGPQPENIIVSDVCDVNFEEFDVAVFFLTIMFIQPHKRRDLIEKLRLKMRRGGCMVIVDKAEAGSGYASTVSWRMTLAGKVSSGIPSDQIVAKEMSLGGVQRPIMKDDLPSDAVEFFRFGDFAGWIIEAK